MAVDHYENFPVASFLLPKKLRYPVEVIYAFARSADDIADEGDASEKERQNKLDVYLTELDIIENQLESQNPLFIHLKKVVNQYSLPITPFRDLISAFKQDTHTKRYPTYESLLDYCKRSANPVGLLMLYLYGKATPENIVMSDAICTALQLINFWQDVAIDWNKNRIYIPQEDLVRFHVTEEMIANGKINEFWRELMQFQVHRARQLMHSGSELPLRIPGRIGWELRFIVHGGLRILERIEAIDFDVFNKRPTLKKVDWLTILKRSILYQLLS